MVEHPGPGGKVLRREVVRHPGSVVIVPILEGPEGARVVLIRNWRPALEKEVLELPAGTLEQGEEPTACARRELCEETGYEAEAVTLLGRFYTSPGLSDEFMTAFVATGLRHVGQRLEEDEQLTVEPMTVPAALAAVERGELVDAKSMLALLLAERRGMLRAG